MVICNSSSQLNPQNLFRIQIWSQICMLVSSWKICLYVKLPGFISVYKMLHLKCSQLKHYHPNSGKFHLFQHIFLKAANVHNGYFPVGICTPNTQMLVDMKSTHKSTSLGWQFNEGQWIKTRFQRNFWFPFCHKDRVTKRFLVAWFMFICELSLQG